jgi:nucleoside-diphosphate-sugar epimerase
MAKVFLTGASGFAGTQIIKRLKNAGHEVYALARNNTEKLIQLGVQPVLGDIRDSASYLKVLAGYKISSVIHCAAAVEFSGAYKDYFEINVLGTIETLRAAAELQVDSFIHMSTAFIFADGHRHKNLSEEDEILSLPKDSYSRTKALAEREVIKWSQKFRTVILRPPLVWGPHMPLIGQYARTIRLIGLPTIGEEQHKLSVLHVKNLAQFTELCVSNYKAKGIYHISDGPAPVLKDFLKVLLAGYSLRSGRFRLSKPLALATALVTENMWKLLRLPGQPPLSRTAVELLGTELTLDTSRAQRELLYRPLLSTEEGLLHLTVQS